VSSGDAVPRESFPRDRVAEAFRKPTVQAEHNLSFGFKICF
jgi:hypothetical protein